MRFLLSLLSISALLLSGFAPHSALAQSTSSLTGAVYTLSNDPTNNAVLVYSATAGGTLSYVTSVLTGGAGPNVNSGDPLRSQGSLFVTDTSLFAVNAGSNTVTQFAINAQNPTQLTFVAQAQTGFSFPVSVAAWSGIVCTLNSGANSGIGCFTYNAAGLTPLPSWSRNINLGQTTPPNGNLPTASQISFSPDGKSLLVSIKSASNGFLLYPIINGQLAVTPLSSSPATAAAPFGFSLLTSSSVFLVDPGTSQVNVFSFNSANGLTDAANVAAVAVNSTLVKALCWSAASQRTGSAYGIGGGGGIVEVAVDPVSLSASVVQYVSSNGVGMLDAAVVTLGGVDYLVTVSPKNQVLLVFALLAQGRVVALNPISLPAGITQQVQGLAVFTTQPATAGQQNGGGGSGANSMTTANGQTIININFQGLFQGLKLN